MSTEHPAEAVLRRLGVTDPSEIDLEAIAWYLGARVRYRPLSACEARIVGTVDQAVITVNAGASRRRGRLSPVFKAATQKPCVCAPSQHAK